MGDHRSPRSTTTERGSGLLGSVLGVGIVMVLLGLAVNLALGLWTRSTVDSVAYDAARRVATAPEGSDPSSVAVTSLEHARRSLGDYGERVELRFEHGPDSGVVVLRVRAPGVALLPRMLGGGPTVGATDRRITITREHIP